MAERAAEERMAALQAEIEAQKAKTEREASAKREVEASLAGVREATKVAQEASYEALARAAFGGAASRCRAKGAGETRGKLTVSLAIAGTRRGGAQNCARRRADATKRAIRAESQLRDVLRREEEAKEWPSSKPRMSIGGRSSSSRNRCVARRRLLHRLRAAASAAAPCIHGGGDVLAACGG